MDLVILGNGFDLHCGLESTYSDFVNWLNKNNYNYQNIFTYLFSSEHKQKNWIDVEKSIEKFLTFFLNKENIEEYQKSLHEYSMSSRYTKMLLFSEQGDSWKNKVEKYINNNYPQYEMINYLLDGILFYDTLDNWIDEYPKIEKAENLEKEKDKEFIKFFLEKEPYIKLHTCLRSNEYSHNIKKQFLVQFFIDELNEMEKLFADFLDEQIHKCTSYEENARQTINKILGPKESLDDTKIITFNYTNPLSDFLPQNKKDVVNNIHGNIINKSCIFGIDIKNIDSDLLLPFTKTYRKLTSEENQNIINNGEKVDNIYFYGHGFGKSDYSYFQAIFDSIDIYNSSTVLNFYYSIYKEEDKENIEYNEYTKVINLINNYGKTLNNKDQGKTILPKLLIENRISINKL